MRKCHVAELLSAIPHSKSNLTESLTFDSIGTDSRKNLSGALFWALKGELHDGHQFLEQAFAHGARAAVVEFRDDHPQAWRDRLIQVPDTTVALAQFAQAVKRGLKVPVLAVTGSNGKTSTKEFTAAILKNFKKIHYNEGSFNNHFGLPFNLLATPQDAELIIAEMGMNHAHEIKHLVEIAEPDVVACTMVGTAHIENFTSQAELAKAKEEIYQFSKPEAIRIYNQDNPWTAAMLARAPTTSKKIIRMSEGDPHADVMLKAYDNGADGLILRGHIDGVRGEVQVPLLGVHNGLNLAMATCFGLATGLAPDDLWSSLPGVQSSWGRNQLLKSEVSQGTRILFDAYNANPESVEALLQTARQLFNRSMVFEGKKYAVFGQMRELGGLSEQAHELWGQKAAQLSFDKVLFFGADARAFQRGWEQFENKNKLEISDTYNESLAQKLISVLGPKDFVVIKGSRGEKLERFVLACQPLNFKLKGN